MTQTPQDKPERGRFVQFPVRPELIDLYDIYKLTDPLDSIVHYIGISTNVTYRYKQHIKRMHCNPHKIAWIRGLQEQGLQPQLDIIERVEGRKLAKERERYWITFYGKQGSLTNIHANPYEIGVQS